jgi:diacylglycerol O-acyltransferase / wax synthase
MQAADQRGDAVAGQVHAGLQDFSPLMLLAPGSRPSALLPQRSVDTVTTNIPGPQHPLFLLGRQMLEVVPYVMLGAQIRIATAIIAFDSNLYIGVTGDYDTAPDIDVMCRGIDCGISDLTHADAAATRPGCSGSCGQRCVDPVGGER